MKRIAIAVLKAKLSEYISKVRAGEELLLTDRNVPVAKIVPLAASDDGVGFLEGLIREGKARPPKKKLPKNFFSTPLTVKDTSDKVLAALLEDRAGDR